MVSTALFDCWTRTTNTREHGSGFVGQRYTFHTEDNVQSDSLHWFSDPGCLGKISLTIHF